MIKRCMAILYYAGLLVAEFAVMEYVPGGDFLVFWFVVFLFAYSNVKDFSERNPEVKEAAKGAIVRVLRNLGK